MNKEEATKKIADIWEAQDTQVNIAVYEVLEELEESIIERYSPSECPHCGYYLDALYPIERGNRKK